MMTSRVSWIILFILLLYPVTAKGTVEYARLTGNNCGFCHIDPTGGGKLTHSGEEFRNELKLKGLYRPLNTPQRVVRFIIGFLHTMTAIIWFGAILYVHLLLKPAYAARGLPKAELLLGWVSMVIMAVTGTLLAIARVPSWDMFLNTRFGILLMIKIALFLVMVSTAAVVTFIIGPKLRRRKQLKIAEHRQDLTMEELAQFDGKEGRPAYVAVAGKIYNVSESRLWKGGSHIKKHHAGFDLTDALKQAPHGEEKIASLPLVGKIIESDEKRSMPTHQKVFYFFAYMNLVLIFLIIFIISLWRWW